MNESFGTVNKDAKEPANYKDYSNNVQNASHTSFLQVDNYLANEKNLPFQESYKISRNRLLYLLAENTGQNIPHQRPEEVKPTAHN